MSRKAPVKRHESEAFVALLVVAAIAIIYILYIASPLSVIVRAVLAIATLMVVGAIIQRTLKLNGGFGLYMLGSRMGLATINRIATKHGAFWDLMWQWGLTMGFGLLAYPLMRGRIDRRAYALGIISLLAVVLIVMPYIAASAIQFINLPQLSGAAASPSVQPYVPTSIITYAIYAIIVVGGFSAYIFAVLIANTGSILWSFTRFVLNPALGESGSGLSSQVPGVAPLIPGIDVPLFASIISLAILLAIHEFSHGVLARRAKVKLKSIGLLAFGFIPIGGYVEPDEKAVSKLPGIKQTSIFSAGIAANFIAMLAFFALFVAFHAYVIPHAYHYGIVVTGTVPNYPANGVLRKGMHVISWNGAPVSSIATLDAAAASDRPNSTVSVLTNDGTYNMTAVPQPSNNSRGIIGVSLGYEPILDTPYAKAAYFIYSVLALGMVLNFLVAVVNLLPIPGLDGWRIFYVNIKRKGITRFLGALVIILLIINALPWLLYL